MAIDTQWQAGLGCTANPRSDETGSRFCLADALADGDTVYAVIRGSAISNDGAAKVGYMAPSVEGQVNVIAEAISMAGVEPESISYVETHGTGTALGDPIEVAALTQAFRAVGTGSAQGKVPVRGKVPVSGTIPTAPVRHCAIGSVKTNLGHLDAAAGIAGLIKTVLALKHGMLPPSLHFHHPNPKIDFANSPFYINTHLTEWKRGNTPRRAGVSSFGIGGTNAHVILEEAPPHQEQERRDSALRLSNPTLAHQERRDSALRLSDPYEGPYLVVLSAKTASALETMTAQLATYVKAHPEAHLNDIAYTLQVGRKAFPYRQAFVAQDRANLLHVLENPDSQSVFKGFVSPDIPVTISTEDQTVLSSLRHPQSLALDRAFLLNTCGRLWCAGMTIDWSLLYEEDSQQRRIPLPTYPFERERYWIDARIGAVGYGTALSVADPVPLSTAGTTTHQRPNLETDYVSPQNETQQQIVTLCQKLLGIEKIGINDDFFDLGGDSLLGTQLITHLCDAFQVDLSLLTFFDAPTVAELALIILQKKAELADDALLLKDLEHLEQLTDDEVQALLTVDENQTGRVEKI
jgi:acyl transferase domain-containing protein